MALQKLIIDKSEKSLSDNQEIKSFYYQTFDKEGNKKDIIIDKVKFIEILKKEGFYRYDLQENSFIFIKIQDNIVRQVNEIFIADWIEKYVSELKLTDGIKTEQILRKFYDSLQRLTNKEFLARLVPKKELKFKTDTLKSAFFYYRNGWIEVTKEKIILKPYLKLDGLIWDDQIQDREYKANSDIKCNFYNFLLNISDRSKPERIKSLKSIIGYLIHKFTDRKLKAIIWLDSRFSDDAEGRSGKTLVNRAIGYILNKNESSKIYCEISGEDFNPKDPYKYQDVSINTSLIHINDAKKYFRFDSLRTDITEGIKIKIIYLKPFTKIVKTSISTNTAIKIEGGSLKDRVIEFELSDYYYEGFGPDTEFKEWFFRDWNEEAWNKFDTIMLNCVQEYLKNGIIKPETINLDIKKLREHTSEQFVDFMEGDTDDWNNRIKKIEFNFDYDKKMLFNEFRERYITDTQTLKQNEFTKWLRYYAEHNKEFEPFNKKNKNINEPRKNGHDYIIFRKKGWQPE